MKQPNDLSFEHAWKYFEVHSQQRMTVFNFYITVVGLLAAGCGISLQQGGDFIYFSTVLGLFITFITFIFYKLDDRVSLLIKKSEGALKYLESHLEHPSFRIFSSDLDHSTLNSGLFSVWTYGRCFRIVFVVLGLAGLILGFTPIVLCSLK